jgi:hypothetical protein
MPKEIIGYEMIPEGGTQAIFADPTCEAEKDGIKCFRHPHGVSVHIGKGHAGIRIWDNEIVAEVPIVRDYSKTRFV